MYLCLQRLLAVLFGCFLLAFAHAKSHHPQEFLSSIKGAKDEGRQIVQHFCVSCHATKPMIQLAAPRIDQKQDWESRVKKSFVTLLKHTEEGFNAMPARGGCFECSEEQLILAILAMLPECLREKSLVELRAHKKNN